MLQNLLNKVVTRLVAVSVVAVSISASLQQPSYASNYKFECKTISYRGRNVPATFASDYDDGRNIIVIRWVHSYFTGKLTNSQRCSIVSRRFQQFHDHGKLSFLKGGYVRSLPVVCAIRSEENSCNKDNVLYTLRPGQNPQDTARRLFNNRGLAAGMIVNESGSDSLIIDFNAFLDNAGGQSQN